jgi:GNAT superfamily N-acetyltransferase
MSLEIRVAKEEDGPYFMKWVRDPLVLRWFPMTTEPEIEDAMRILLSYAKMGATWTALWNGEPCGIANLYIQPFKKIAHQCLLSIVLDEKHRGRGIGTQLMNHLMHAAKHQFHIELLHLEVYEGNPAVHFYHKLGFTEYGKQKHYIKSPEGYTAAIMMQKKL